MRKLRSPPSEHLAGILSSRPYSFCPPPERKSKMASCAYCNTSILFGGKRLGDLRFCNAECQQRGGLAIVASEIPDSEVSRYVMQVHNGSCPLCNGQGPVDVHTSYRVWSALVLTQWSSRPSICCRSCGIKKTLGDTAFSAVLGWWGLPWGLLMTPVQIIRNVFSLVRGPDPTTPTPALHRLVRLRLALSLAAQRQSSA